MNEMFYEYLKIVKVLVGYKYSAAIENVLDNVLYLLNKVYNLNSNEIDKLRENIHDLFKIDSYNAYKMALSINDPERKELLRNANMYVEILANKSNVSIDFCEKEFKDIVNQLSLKNNFLDYKRFQGILYYLGVIYNKSEEAAIKILKFTAVRGDLISIRLLSVIDSVNKDKYNELENALTQIYEGLVIDLDELKCSDKVKKLCRLILITKNEIDNSQDRPNQKYSVIDKHSKEKEALDLLNGVERTVKRIGF